MSGSATPMMLVSMMTMNCASAMTARAVQRRGLTAGGMTFSLGRAPRRRDGWTGALLTAAPGARRPYEGASRRTR